jgi:YidC/Oxa1 family membrane protein insertase
MDRRFALALLLSALVFFITPFLFPPAPRPPEQATRPDTARVTAAPETTRAVPGPAVQPTPAPTRPGADTIAQLSQLPAETTAVVTPRAEYRFSNVGASLIAAEMRTYRDLATGRSSVQLGRPGMPLLHYDLVTATDTIDLAAVRFTGVHSRRGETELVEYRAPVSGGEFVVRYALGTDTAASYRLSVSGEARGIPDARHLIVWLPSTFPSPEADSSDDRRYLAYAFMSAREGARSISFSSLDPGERQLIEGPHSWAAAKTKYFVVGLLAPRSGEQQFAEATVIGAPRTSRTPTHAAAAVVQSLAGGAFQFDVYAGPQEWERLLSVGQEFDQVNPYGWKFLQGIVQPLAVIVMRILLWMHNALQISYGWVLVIFGIAVRVVLWPLNQRAMRSSMKMQQLHPKIVEVQKRYANNPEKQREELMRVYRDAGTSPFAAMSGCLPMLIPMPFLFALFFVFQNTIEFRGVPFLWLSDISIKDPYYIVPLAMGATMYLLSWIGLRNSPPNPQAKMMAYMLPVMMTVFLLNFAAGLNLYYAVQNLAAIPQQWLINRERAKMALKPAT